MAVAKYGTVEGVRDYSARLSKRLMELLQSEVTNLCDGRGSLSPRLAEEDPGLDAVLLDDEGILADIVDNRRFLVELGGEYYEVVVRQIEGQEENT
jgi:hypothetical protein